MHFVQQSACNQAATLIHRVDGPTEFTRLEFARLCPELQAVTDSRAVADGRARGWPGAAGRGRGRARGRRDARRGREYGFTVLNYIVVGLGTCLA